MSQAFIKKNNATFVFEQFDFFFAEGKTQGQEIWLKSSNPNLAFFNQSFIVKTRIGSENGKSWSWTKRNFAKQSFFSSLTSFWQTCIVKNYFLDPDQTCSRNRIQNLKFLIEISSVKVSSRFLAQRQCSCFSPCSPGFKSEAQHHHIFNLDCKNWCYIC